jgi:H+/Na+-translocating ferredoxin:NAD+ oxidoreductase subunit B
MGQDIYQELRKQLDTYPLGFPATESGTELKILKKLFRKDDAELFLTMTQKLETAEQIAERVGKPDEEIAARLEDITERGLTFGLGNSPFKPCFATLRRDRLIFSDAPGWPSGRPE